MGVGVITLQTGAVQSSFAGNMAYKPLPPHSWYKPIEAAVAKWASGQMHPRGQAQAVFCKTVVDHVEKRGTRGLVFEGVLSWVVKFAVGYLPRWALVSWLRYVRDCELT